ncbi:MAG: response regulator transcription factor [Bacteroidales bacterium]|jgi:DNA-binding response OmpR family regulator
MPKILIIEDEVNVSSFIKKGLEEEGFITESAFDGEIGLNLACTHEFDAIILDVILPRMNGIEVCQRIRKEMGYSVPILMLTALGSTDDIIKGLETGADDYLSKPFKFRELIARINVMLRRKDTADFLKIYQFSDLSLDTRTKSVTRSGREIKLTSKEFRLLEFFMKNPGRVLSRTSILENVWDSNVDPNTNIVEVYVNYLRNKIDKGYQVNLIHTLIGMGYVLKEE